MSSKHTVTVAVTYIITGSTKSGRKSLVEDCLSMPHGQSGGTGTIEKTDVQIIDIDPPLNAKPGTTKAKGGQQ